MEDIRRILNDVMVEATIATIHTNLLLDGKSRQFPRMLSYWLRSQYAYDPEPLTVR